LRSKAYNDSVRVIIQSAFAEKIGKIAKKTPGFG
jgi:hypothetical protein